MTTYIAIDYLDVPMAVLIRAPRPIDALTVWVDWVEQAHGENPDLAGWDAAQEAIASDLYEPDDETDDAPPSYDARCRATGTMALEALGLSRVAGVYLQCGAVDDGEGMVPIFGLIEPGWKEADIPEAHRAEYAYGWDLAANHVAEGWDRMSAVYHAQRAVIDAHPALVRLPDGSIGIGSGEGVTV